MSLSKQDLNSLAALLESHEDRLAEKIGLAIALQLRTADPAQSPHVQLPPPGERFCRNQLELAATTGLTMHTLGAIARASRRGPGSPFVGRGAYPSAIHRWLASRPGFNASQFLKNGALPPPSSTSGPTGEESEPFCNNLTDLAAALGLTKADISGLRRVAKLNPDASPFIGRGGYPGVVRRWVKEQAEIHPAFTRFQVEKRTSLK